MKSQKFKLPAVTKNLAPQHEALFVRLTALVEQSRATATRHPAGKVSDETSRTAKALLDEAKVFRAPDGRNAVPAPDWGGLFTQLSQALADLDAYEAGQTFWDAGQKCRMWLTMPEPLPVLRLRPAVKTPGTTKLLTRSGKDMRAELARMIKAKTDGAYREGYEAGLAAGRLKSGQVPDSVEQSQTYPRILRPV